jgi:uncharacterized protein (TIGR02611 family)
LRTPPDETTAQKWRSVLQSARDHPSGRLVWKILIAILGGLVVAVGAVLIPLPGPGWLIVLAGLGIWAVEFRWARRLLQFTRQKLRGWTAWVGRQPLPTRLLIGLLGLLFVAGVAVLTIRYSLGVNLVGAGWKYLSTH